MTFKTEVPQRCKLLILKDKSSMESAVAFHLGKCEAASNKPEEMKVLMRKLYTQVVESSQGCLTIS